MSASNTNEAPYPTDLEDLVSRCSYRPWWQVALRDVDRGQGSKGLTLVITTNTINTYRPDEFIAVNHFFPVPPAAYDRRSWQRWLFEQFRLVESHECAEFFKIDDERPYAPSHGYGQDPYMIREVGTDEDRRTSFRNEIKPRGDSEGADR